MKGCYCKTAFEKNNTQQKLWGSVWERKGKRTASWCVDDRNITDPFFGNRRAPKRWEGIVCVREWKNERDGLYVCVLWIRGNELSQALSYEFSQALAPLINDTCHSVRVWQSSWEGLWCMAALQKEIRLFWHGRRPCPLYKVPAFLHGCFFFLPFFSPHFFFTQKETLLWAGT